MVAWGKSVVLVVLVLCCVAAPARAAEAPSSSIVWYQGVGLGFTSDKEAVFIPSNATLSASGTAGQVTIAAQHAEGRYALTFAAPPGRTLQPGKHYVRAKPLASDRPGQPGVHATSPQVSDCWDGTGSFEVRDLATRADGTVSRAWIVFEIDCRMSGPLIQGEARYGMPAPPAGQLVLAPAVTRWHADDLGRPGRERPVWLIGESAAARYDGVSAYGPDAKRFAGNGCWKYETTPPDACQIDAHYFRTAPGTHDGKLWVADKWGGGASTDLAGFTYGGVTRFAAESEDPDEWVGEGGTYDYDGGDLRFIARGTPDALNLWASEYDRDTWDGEFEPAPGDKLQAGREYDGARGYGSGADDRPMIDVSGRGHTCGSFGHGWFRVNELRFDEFGDVRAASVTWEQRCGEYAYSMWGQWDFRAGDTTPLAPWMVLDPSVQDPPGKASPETQTSGGSGSQSGTGAGSTGAAPTPPPAPGSAPVAAPTPRSVVASRRLAVVVARSVTRATLRRQGLRVKLAGLRPGARVRVSLRQGRRVLARVAKAARGGSLSAALRPRTGVRAGTRLELVVTVRAGGGRPSTLVRRVDVRR